MTKTDLPSTALRSEIENRPHSNVDLNANPSTRDIVAFSVMCLGMYLGLTNIQIVNSSFKEIQGGLAASSDQISWVLTSALIAEVIMLPLSGWLSRVCSTRWLFTTCLGCFSLASAGCANAWNIESMIVFRALQGFSAGALMPLVFAAVYTVFPPRRQALVMTVMSFCMVTSSAAGPVLGGWITDVASWPFMFWISVPTGFALMIASAFLIRIDKAEPSLARNIDFLGISLAATSLVCLLVVLEEGRRQDWFDSRLILTLTLVSGASAYLFFWRELTCRHPVVDLRAFKNRNFSVGCFYITSTVRLVFNLSKNAFERYFSSKLISQRCKRDQIVTNCTIKNDALPHVRTLESRG